MIISDRYKFIYLKIPKTAGSSVQLFLAAYNDRPQFAANKVVYNIKIHTAHYLQHSTYQQFQALTGDSEADAYFKFTFVRNPYCKFYSAYQQHKFAFKQILEDSEFNEYVQNNINTDRIHNIWNFAEFLPCSFYTHVNGEKFVDFIGYCEDFQKSLEQILAELNISIDKVLQNKNVREKVLAPCDPYKMNLSNYKYLDKFDRKTIELVNEIYSKDFKYLGYKMLSPNTFPEYSERL